MVHRLENRGTDHRPALFRDRADAGRRLADRLLPLRDQGPVVLALPRGGVAVAVEIARGLHAPLGLVLVRKLGAPHQPEFAIGAIASCGASCGTGGSEAIEAVINPAFGGCSPQSWPRSWITRETDKQLEELERRRKTYLAGRKQPAIAGRIAILVDDGIATGATMLAALQAVRKEKPRAVVVAVPVAPADRLAEFAGLADATLCLETPIDFQAIGPCYRDFDQLDDMDVIRLLDRAGKTTPAPEAQGPHHRIS